MQMVFGCVHFSAPKGRFAPYILASKCTHPAHHSRVSFIMISKIIIPAAGKGTRMLDLAKDMPKHLINVLDKPFLYYVLKNLQVAGFEKMILVVGHKAEKMQEFADQYKDEFAIQLVNQFEVMGKEKYGTAIPVLASREAVGEENFVCMYGDNLYSTRDLSAIRELYDDFNYINIIHSDTPEKYGVPILDGDMVKDFIEKPKEFISNWVTVGCYAFCAEIFDACEKVQVSDRGEYELTDAIRALAKSGRVKARKMQDFRIDFGNPDDIQKVAQFLESSKM